MKILHTSDWHLGQHFYRFDRDDEHEYFIHQLTEIVKAEQPDALVVSGDVYDSSIPTVVAQRRFVQSLLELHQACPSCEIVVTAGNHDSGNRLDVLRPIWTVQGVHVVGTCRRDDAGLFDAREFIIPIADCGYVVAVPYFHRTSFPLTNENTERDQRQQQFFEKVMRTVTEMNTNHLPIVLMAHLAVEGCDIRGHEEGLVGGMEMESLSQFGSGYDYLALGHIHKPQNISARVRYSGSPIPLSFSEDYPHSVSIVEINHHDDIPQIRCDQSLVIRPLRGVKTITAPSLDDALSALSSVDDDVYVRLLIDQDDILPADAEQRALLVAQDKLCRLCEVRKVLRKRDTTADTTFDEIDITDPECDIKPIDIAKRYFLQTHNVEMSAELTRLMEEVIAEVENPLND